MNKLMYCFMNDINYSMILKNKISLLNLFSLIIIKKINKTNKRLPELKLLYLVFKIVLKIFQYLKIIDRKMYYLIFIFSVKRSSGNNIRLCESIPNIYIYTY